MASGGGGIAFDVDRTAVVLGVDISDVTFCSGGTGTSVDVDGREFECVGDVNGGSAIFSGVNCSNLVSSTSTSSTSSMLLDAPFSPARTDPLLLTTTVKITHC